MKSFFVWLITKCVIMPFAWSCIFAHGKLHGCSTYIKYEFFVHIFFTLRKKYLKYWNFKLFSKYCHVPCRSPWCVLSDSVCMIHCHHHHLILACNGNGDYDRNGNWYRYGFGYVYGYIDTNGYANGMILFIFILI